MANQILGTRSPNGDVGVDGVLDSAELNAYTQGILSGFEPSVSGWNITLSSGSSQSSCIARNADGLSDIFAGVGDITFTIDGAPATSGQARIDVLVAYKDATLVSEANNGLDTVEYMVVKGTAGGSPNSPSMQDIRNAVPNGEEAFITVLGEVYLNYGAGLTLGRIALRRAKLHERLIPPLDYEPPIQDTGWQALPLNTAAGAGFQKYSANDEWLPRYRKIGNMVQITGAISPNSNREFNATMQVISYLPQNLHPSGIVVDVQQGGGRRFWTTKVFPDGRLTAEKIRYDNTGYLSAGTAEAMQFNVVYFV